MHYYFVVSSHKADLNLSYLYSLGSFLGSSLEVWLNSLNNGPLLPFGNHQVLNSCHSNGHHHKSNILKLVKLDELSVFYVIHLVEIVEEVGISILLRPLFVESRVYSKLKLHFEYPAPLYLSFKPEPYHGDSDSHWLEWSQWLQLLPSSSYTS